MRLGFLALGVVAAIGCNGGTTSGGPSDAEVVCPSTVMLANGAACSREGYACWIGFSCGPYQQQAECVCTAGTYLCTDQAQGAIGPGGSPECKPFGGPNDSQCPASAVAAQSSACQTPGLLCFYAGAVCERDASPPTDECQCVGNLRGVEAGSPLAYDCQISRCPTAFDASLDSGAESAADGAIDGGVDGAAEGGD